MLKQIPVQYATSYPTAQLNGAVKTEKQVMQAMSASVGALVARYLNSNGAGVVLEDVLHLLSLMPIHARHQSARILQNQRLMTALKKNQDQIVLLNVLIQEYDLANQHLECYICNEESGETIFMLLEWAKQENRLHTLAHPLEYYLTWLARDPWWAIYWLQFNKEHADILLKKIVHYCVINRHKTPGATYGWLVLNEKTPTPQCVESLRESPFYIWVSRLQFRDIPLEIKLPFNVIQPRWAYHLLISKQFIEREKLMDILKKDLFWLIEYVIDENIIDGEGDPLVATALRESANTLLNSFDKQESTVVIGVTSIAQAWIARLKKHIEKKGNAKAA